MASEFINRVPRSGGSDRERLIRDILKMCQDGKEALFLRVSQFLLENEAQPTEKPGVTLRDKILDIRQKSYEQIWNRFRNELIKAVYLQVQVLQDPQDCPNFCQWINQALRGSLGDPEVSTSIKDIIPVVVGNYNKKDRHFFFKKSKDNKNENNFPDYPRGMNDTHGVHHCTKMAFALRTSVSILNKLLEQLVVRKRSERLFENMARAQNFEEVQVSCSSCGSRNSDVDQYLILAGCGHLICLKCPITTQCPTEGCNSLCPEYQNITASELHDGTTAAEASDFGSKIDDIVELIQNPDEKEEFLQLNEKALVFVQHDETKKALQKALDKARITHAELSKGLGRSSSILNNFQNNERIRVLIMNIKDASAAGR